MLSEIVGNKGDYDLVQKASGQPSIIAYTRGWALYPSIIHSVGERIKKAAESGDEAEVNKLNKYYTNAKPADFLVENPILTKDGSYRFNYTNRANGFAVVDSVMVSKKYTLREIIETCDMEVFKPKRVTEIRDYFDQFQETQKVILVDLLDLGVDVIVVSTTDSHTNKLHDYITELGFNNMVYCDWALPGFDRIDSVSEMWSYVDGVIGIDTPAIDGGPTIIPIINYWNLIYMVPEDGSPVGGWKLSTTTQPTVPACYIFGDADANLPEQVFDFDGAVIIEYDNVPITKEIFDKIEFSPIQLRNYDLSIETSWNEEKKAVNFKASVKRHSYWGVVQERLSLTFLAYLIDENDEHHNTSAVFGEFFVATEPVHPVFEATLAEGSGDSEGLKTIILSVKDPITGEPLDVKQTNRRGGDHPAIIKETGARFRTVSRNTAGTLVIENVPVEDIYKEMKVLSFPLNIPYYHQAQTSQFYDIKPLVEEPQAAPKRSRKKVTPAEE